MISYCRSKKGSAYLFVLGAIVVTMLLLVFSLKKTVNTRKEQFSIENHLRASNAADSCVAYIYHQFKVNPQLAKDQVLELDSGKCEIKIESSDGNIHKVKITGESEGMKMSRLVRIKGYETETRSQWEMELLPSSAK
jgi:hypothetical protein